MERFRNTLGEIAFQHTGSRVGKANHQSERDEMVIRWSPLNNSESCSVCRILDDSVFLKLRMLFVDQVWFWNSVLVSFHKLCVRLSRCPRSPDVRPHSRCEEKDGEEDRLPRHHARDCDWFIIDCYWLVSCPLHIRLDASFQSDVCCLGQSHWGLNVHHIVLMMTSNGVEVFVHEPHTILSGRDFASCSLSLNYDIMVRRSCTARCTARWDGECTAIVMQQCYLRQF